MARGAPVAPKQENDIDRQCFAEPLAISSVPGLLPRPIEGFRRRALDSLLAGVDGECMGIDIRGKDEFAEEISVPLDPVECKDAIGRLYFETHRWVEAARWFRRATLDDGGDEVAGYVVRLYIESLRILGAEAEPPRPSCFGVMRRDAELIACGHCGEPRDAEWEKICTMLQEVRFELHHRGVLPARRTDDPCGPGQRFGSNECEPLPPMVPRSCSVGRPPGR